MSLILFPVNAIMPIIMQILFGYFLKSINFLDESWFRKGNKLIFRVCLPCMLFNNVYKIKSLASINWSVILYSEILIFLVFFAGLFLVRRIISDPRQKGPVLQCFFRSNFAIIGLPLAEALGGEEGVAIAAILTAFSIPTFNVLAVISLSIFSADGQKLSLKSTLKKIITNPLILGVMCGFVCIVIRSFLPVKTDGSPMFTLSGNLSFIYSLIENLAKISSPLALIILGGLFNFSAVKELKKQIIVGTAGRVAIVPLIAIGGAVIFSKCLSIEYTPGVYSALVALFGSPVAVSSAIMAQEMDNDGVLAGQFVVWTSIVSIFTLSFFIISLRQMGLM